MIKHHDKEQLLKEITTAELEGLAYTQFLRRQRSIDNGGKNIVVFPRNCLIVGFPNCREPLDLFKHIRSFGWGGMVTTFTDDIDLFRGIGLSSLEDCKLRTDFGWIEYDPRFHRSTLQITITCISLFEYDIYTLENKLIRNIG